MLSLTKRHRLTVVEKARLLVMLSENSLTNQEIADHFACNIRTIQRYRRQYDASGKLFPAYGKTGSNAVRLSPWALEQLKEELVYHPNLYLDKMQWFLAEACQV
ncbi:hypothetical protein F4810DRAFT_693532 [Camillea tinctor]|nr:hypothetical protein F4810DRAFT_693532 [Camillea tinctor]